MTDNQRFLRFRKDFEAQWYNTYGNKTYCESQWTGYLAAMRTKPQPTAEPDGGVEAMANALLAANNKHVGNTMTLEKMTPNAQRYWLELANGALTHAALRTHPQPQQAGVEWRDIADAPNIALVRTSSGEMYDGFRTERGAWRAPDPSGGGSYLITEKVTHWYPALCSKALNQHSESEG